MSYLGLDLFFRRFLWI
uniref:Uncharacterized protein n=1 Tax=Rhizophora mucronata TaxID=61149 RepID=A0A2P2P7S3_RHIMU